MQQSTDQLIQILTDEGTVHGDVEVTYSPPDEKLTFVDLEVRRPDGKVVVVYYFTDARTGPERYIGATIWEIPAR